MECPLPLDGEACSSAGLSGGEHSIDPFNHRQASHQNCSVLCQSTIPSPIEQEPCLPPHLESELVTGGLPIPWEGVWLASSLSPPPLRLTAFSALARMKAEPGGRRSKKDWKFLI